MAAGPEQLKQADFFEKLESLDAVKRKPKIKATAESQSVKAIKKQKPPKFNPPYGRLGGWISRVDGNLDDPDNERNYRFLK